MAIRERADPQRRSYGMPNFRIHFFQPDGTGHGTPHCASCFFVHPPAAVCLDMISSSVISHLSIIPVLRFHSLRLSRTHPLPRRIPCSPPGPPPPYPPHLVSFSLKVSLRIAQRVGERLLSFLSP